MNLTSTQRSVLSSALQRDDGTLQLPGNLKGEAAQKLTAKLVDNSLAEELAATGSMPVWRKDNDQKLIALRITAAGVAAIQRRAASANKAAQGGRRPGLRSLRLIQFWRRTVHPNRIG